MNQIWLHLNLLPVYEIHIVDVYASVTLWINNSSLIFYSFKFHLLQFWLYKRIFQCIKTNFIRNNWSAHRCVENRYSNRRSLHNNNNNNRHRKSIAQWVYWFSVTSLIKFLFRIPKAGFKQGLANNNSQSLSHMKGLPTITNNELKNFNFSCNEDHVPDCAPVSNDLTTRIKRELMLLLRIECSCFVFRVSVGISRNNAVEDRIDTMIVSSKFMESAFSVSVLDDIYRF